MKFDDALGKALIMTPDSAKPKGDDNYPKILALLWTMLAVSENVLDDTAYIDNNKKIISVPLQKSSTPKKTAAKNKANKKEEAKAEDIKTGDGKKDLDDGKEEPSEH